MAVKKNMAGSISFIKVESEAGINNVSALAETIWFEYFPNIISIQQIEYMLDKFLSQKAISEQISQGTSFYIVKKDRELVGFIAIRVDDSSGRRRLFLSKLYLEKFHRGGGIASRMFAFVKEQAAERNCDSVFLTVNKINSHAINVYYHWGFKKEKDLVTDIGNGFVMDDYVMSLDLAQTPAGSDN